MTQEHVRLIERWLELQASHEMDKLADIFTEDIVYDDVAINSVTVGHAKLKELFETIYASMPDYTVTLVSAVADEDRGGAEFIMSGTHVGDFPKLPATGKSFSLRAAAAMRFSNGRISHWNDYWSVLTFKEQVGLE